MPRGAGNAPGSLAEQKVPRTVRSSSAPGDAPSYSAGHKGLRTVRGEKLPPNKFTMYRYSTRLIKKTKVITN